MSLTETRRNGGFFFFIPRFLPLRREAPPTPNLPEYAHRLSTGVSAVHHAPFRSGAEQAAGARAVADAALEGEGDVLLWACQVKSIHLLGEFYACL